MELETKFLRLRQPVKVGDEIDGWRVCWLGGWGRDRLFYMVMVVRAKQALDSAGIAFRCDVDPEAARKRWPIRA